MIKKLKTIYALIFIAAFLLAIISLIDYIRTDMNIKWIIFVLGVIIMTLSLWGYKLVKKHSLAILTRTTKEVFKKK